MVIDAAKGIEARTRKLFEVCRLRDIPIITFINKMDRESRDTFELLDEIEKTLALDTTPMTWPVGRGRDFLGTYDVRNGGVRLLEGGGAKTGATEQIDIADLAGRKCQPRVTGIKDELALVSEACKPFDLAAFREGHLTPVYFGSACAISAWAICSRASDGSRRRRARRIPTCARSRHQTAHERVRVQDPAKHGSEPSRPHRLCAAVLGKGSTAA